MVRGLSNLSGKEMLCEPGFRVELVLHVICVDSQSHELSRGDAGFSEQMSDVKLLDARSVLGASQRWESPDIVYSQVVILSWGSISCSWRCGHSHGKSVQVSQRDFFVVPADRGDSTACPKLGIGFYSLGLGDDLS